MSNDISQIMQNVISRYVFINIHTKNNVYLNDDCVSEDIAKQAHKLYMGKYKNYDKNTWIEKIHKYCALSKNDILLSKEYNKYGFPDPDRICKKFENMCKK